MTECACADCVSSDQSLLSILMAAEKDAVVAVVVLGNGGVLAAVAKNPRDTELPTNLIELWTDLEVGEGLHLNY